MFLFVGTLTYGQDLISVDVKVDTDKLIELLDKKDKEIDLMMKNLKILSEAYEEKEIELEEAYGVINSLHHYKLYYDHSKHVIGPRIIKKIELMIKKDE